MNIDKILNSIKHFLEVEDWSYFHLKADSPTGQRREMVLTNVPVVQAESQQSIIEQSQVETPVETSEQRITRIFPEIKAGTPIPDADAEWWKQLQLQLGQDGTRAQVEQTDTLEAAIQKFKEAGLV